MKKIKLKYPLLVEGSYDKNRVMSVVEGTVITTCGFAVFNSGEKKALLRRITENGKLIVLTDSDGAGMLIRNKLKGYLPPDSVINLYTPALAGKEKRKKQPSKAGVLGVEGMSDDILYALLAPYGENGNSVEHQPVSTAFLYEKGFTGKEDSASKRVLFCKQARLPEGLTPKAFKEAVNLLGGREFFDTILAEIEIKR